MLRKEKEIEKNLCNLHQRKTLWIYTCLRGSAAALQREPKTKKIQRVLLPGVCQQWKGHFHGAAQATFHFRKGQSWLVQHHFFCLSSNPQADSVK